MSAFYVGDRVLVCAHWSSFHGMKGTVKSAGPLMVLLDGDAQPMRFGEREVVREAESQRHVGGAE